MNAKQTADVLSLIAVLLGWAFFFFGMMPVFRLDWYRQQLFAIRDELFDYAEAGHISFDDPAYMLLRSQMNAMIRYGHQMTVFRLLMTYCAEAGSPAKPQSPGWNERWRAALDSLEDSIVREQLEAYYAQEMVIARDFLVRGSVVLIVLSVSIKAAAGLRKAGVRSRNIRALATRKVLAGPLDQRRIEEEAWGACA